MRFCRCFLSRCFWLGLCCGFGCSLLAAPALAQQSEQEQVVEEEQKRSEEADEKTDEKTNEESNEQAPKVVCSLKEEKVAPAFLRAQNYLRHLPAVQTRFVQYDAKGVEHEGLLRLSPPYRMRLDYDAPSGLRLYVNAKEALHVDTKRKFVRQYPVVALPVVRMLQRIFAGKGAEALQATRVCVIEDEYEVLRMRFRKKATRTAMRTEMRRMVRAMSSARLTTRDALTPGAGSNA